MREVFSHLPGKVLIAVLAVSAAAVAAAPFFFGGGGPVLGWMPLPFAIGLAFTLLWLAAVSIYAFRFWPFR